MSEGKVDVHVTMKWSKQVLDFDISLMIPSSSLSSSSLSSSSTSATTTDGSLLFHHQQQQQQQQQQISSSSSSSSSYTGRTFKEHVCHLTGVPIERQKIMVIASNNDNSKRMSPGRRSSSSGSSSLLLNWKGVLKDDFDFIDAIRQQQQQQQQLQEQQKPQDQSSSSSSAAAPTASTTLKVTLIGTAEVLSGPTHVTTFLEDMTIQQRQEVESAHLQAMMIETRTVGLIPALQRLPQHRHLDSKRQVDEMYEYNRLVHGLPQYQIEKLLLQQQQQQTQEKEQDAVTATTTTTTTTSTTTTQTSHPLSSVSSPPTTDDAVDDHDHDNDNINIIGHKTNSSSKSHNINNSSSSSSNNNNNIRLGGRVAMTLGLELQRAYVNDLAVLDPTDGTLVSVLEDGHIHLWKHCQRIQDVIHEPSVGNNGMTTGGVTCVLAIDSTSTGTDRGGGTNSTDYGGTVAFATAGRGAVRLWNTDADQIMAVSSPYPSAADPTSLVQVRYGSPPLPHDVATSTTGFDAVPSIPVPLCIAARYHITRPPSQRPRLVPQDDAGRQRLAYIVAQEDAIDETLTRLSKTVQVWYHHGASSSSSSSSSSPPPATTTTMLRSVMLQAPAPVTCLVSWMDPISNNTDGYLAAGDINGGIQLWKVTSNDDVAGSSGYHEPHFSKLCYYQLTVTSEITHPTTDAGLTSIVSMKYLTDERTNRLVVSTGRVGPSSDGRIPIAPSPIESISIQIPVSQAVHIINVGNVLSPTVEVSLNGHKDVVQCMLQLPNGDLLTAGGKNDATIKVWRNEQIMIMNPSPSSSTSPPTNNVGMMVQTEAAIANLCKDVGYVFALVLLRDTQPGSNYYAIGAARYNVIRLIV